MERRSSEVGHEGGWLGLKRKPDSINIPPSVASFVYDDRRVVLDWDHDEQA